MISLEPLIPNFRSKVEELIKACRYRNTKIVPYYTVRSPQVQARLWRQSRTFTEVKQMIEDLKSMGCDYLADVIVSVGPQPSGRWATNSIPGLSWHQWGEAIDCYIEENGAAIWDAKHIGYDIYAEEAKKLGLTSGHYWKSKDSVHVQLREKEVLDEMSILDVNSKLKNIFPLRR